MTERFEYYCEPGRGSNDFEEEKATSKRGLSDVANTVRLGLDAACPGELALLKTLAAEDWPALCRTERHGCFLTAG